MESKFSTRFTTKCDTSWLKGESANMYDMRVAKLVFQLGIGWSKSLIQKTSKPRCESTVYRRYSGDHTKHAPLKSVTLSTMKWSTGWLKRLTAKIPFMVSMDRVCQLVTG